jgi:hypothetical protein
MKAEEVQVAEEIVDTTSEKENHDAYLPKPPAED